MERPHDSENLRQAAIDRSRFLFLKMDRSCGLTPDGVVEPIDHDLNPVHYPFPALVTGMRIFKKGDIHAK